MSRLDEYIQYHAISEQIGDIDPSYAMLRYVCDRFELNIEQRFWLSYLYSTCYNASTVFYIYNEFPDYLGVDVGRLQRWWNANRDRLDFQTDCRWVRSRNQFVQMFIEYRMLCGRSQEETYHNLVFRKSHPYRSCYSYFEQIHNFGRFKLFLLLEAVHVVTGFDIEPDELPLEQAQSSCNGLCYALNRDDLLRGNDYGDKPLLAGDYEYLYIEFEKLLKLMRSRFPDKRIDYWNVETTLCAYKKWHRGKRYPGYYLTRQAKEIMSMRHNVPEGVCWEVLWDYRKECLDHKYLYEFTGREDPGVFGNDTRQISIFEI